MSIDSQHKDFYNPEYEKNCYLGGDNWTGEKYLFHLSFENKSGEQRKLRNEKFIHFNFSALVINTFNVLKFKKDPAIDLKKHLDESYNDNIDGKGTDLIQQIKDIDVDSDRDGISYLLIDQPDFPEGISKETESKLYRKRIQAIERENIIDWSIDVNGNYNWVKIYHVGTDDRDPLAEKEEAQFITVYTKEKISQYKLIEDEKDKTEDWILQWEKESPFAILGIVPVVPILQGRKGISLIRDIAKLDQRLDNQTSLIDHLHRVGSNIIPEIQAGTELKDNGFEIQYERAKEDSIGLEFKTPENPIMSDIRLEREQTISIIQEITNTVSDNKVKPIIGVLSDRLDQEAIIEKKIKTLEEGFKRALMLLAWFDNEPKADNLDKYLDIVVRFNVDGLFGKEVTETVEAYAAAIIPTAPLIINQELYKTMITQLLNRFVNTAKMTEIYKEINELPKEFFTAFNGLDEIPDT